MKAALKQVMLHVAPDTSLRMLSIRSRRFIERQATDLGFASLARRVAEATESRVLSGPFAGMLLDYDLLPVHAAPKFLGTYESELHDVVERIIHRRPHRVLNVGCAEGYYAVGLGMRLPEATVFAADADPKAERATQGNARINGILSRVKTTGILHQGEFARYVNGPRSFIMMDVEGAEYQLLCPKIDGVLRSTDILVELHPGSFSEPISAIADRFSKSHGIEHILPRSKSIERFASLGLSAIELQVAVNERRSDNSWLYLEAKEI